MSLLDEKNQQVEEISSDESQVTNDVDDAFLTSTDQLNNLHNDLDTKSEQLNQQNSHFVLEKTKEYQEKVNQFKDINNLENLQTVYVNNKEEQLKSFNSLIKKNKQDYTYKINSFEREYLAKSKEIEAEIKEIKKSYKNKASELNRKTEHDIKRITDLAKRKSSPLDKELLVVNEPIHIKTINNEIKKIRKESFEEIYFVNKQSLEELQKLEIDYRQSIIKKETEIQVFREQLNIKIAEIKEKIEELNIDEKVNSASYDFNYEEILLNKEKDNLVTLNDYERDFLTELAKIQKEFAANLHEINLKKLDVIFNFKEIIAQHLDSEISQIFAHKEQMYQTFMDKINNISKLSNNLVITLEHTIKDKIAIIKKDLINYNDNFLNKSVVNDSNKFTWQLFDYQFNYLLFLDEIKQSKVNQNKKLDKYFKELSSQIKVLNNVLNAILKSITSWIENEISSDQALMKKYLNHHQGVMENVCQIIDNKKFNLIAKYDQSQVELDNKIKKINLDYEQNNRVILEQFNNNIVAHQARIKNFDEEINQEKNTLATKFAAIIQEGRQNINLLNETQKQKIKDITIEAKEKYQEKYRNILLEKKEQIKLL